MIRLEKMAKSDFKDFLNRMVPDYADDCVRAGRWEKEGALEKSQKAFAELLPQELDTPTHFLFSIQDVDVKTTVGYLWVKIDERSAFIFQILIFPKFQGQGRGSEALKQLSALLKKQGIEKLGLHVFKHNAGAIKLYEKLGFEETSRNMSKEL